MPEEDAKLSLAITAAVGKSGMAHHLVAKIELEILHIGPTTVTAEVQEAL